MKLVYTLMILLGSVSIAEACNIPVFRYALERWRPDECEVIVFHQGGLTPQQESLLAASLPAARSPQSARAQVTGAQVTGARVLRADLSDADGPHQDLWLQLAGDAAKSLPYVVIRAKIGTGRTVNAWHGPLDSVHDWDVFKSPARTEVARRLLAGHSVVWMLITSDDEERNAEVRELLEERLDALSNKIQLPDGIGLPGSELYSEIPLLVKFSMLEVRRDNPDERFLIDLFSGFRPDSLSQGEPLVVPVFGRGRALEVIPAGELNAQLLEDLTAFLSGACSCQVKEQNPGFDLLFSVDWNTELFGEGFEPPPAKTVDDRGQPQLLTIPPGR
jgi:hypothetical protein